MYLDCGRKPEEPAEKPTQAQWEHRNSTQKGPADSRFSPRPFCWEATVLITNSKQRTLNLKHQHRANILQHDIDQSVGKVETQRRETTLAWEPRWRTCSGCRALTNGALTESDWRQRQRKRNSLCDPKGYKCKLCSSFKGGVFILSLCSSLHLLPSPPPYHLPPFLYPSILWDVMMLWQLGVCSWRCRLFCGTAVGAGPGIVVEL